ncbi:MAG TPA: trehalose-phosphatase [Actinomycetota bacterium]
MTLPERLAPLADDPGRSAVLLDFDGSLAEIAPRPEVAPAAPGAREAVRAVAARFGLVAVISGRPTADLSNLLGVDGVRYVGLYGLEEEAGPGLPGDLVPLIERMAASLPGTWVEDKGGSVAVHYRQALDGPAARERLLAELPPAAANAGLEVIEGKMVVELVPAGRPRKAGAVRRLIGEFRPRAAMYAGDDEADLEAFEELGRSAAFGVHAVRVAVAGPETPSALLDAADVTVDGPRALVELLRDLAAAAGRPGGS